MCVCVRVCVCVYGVATRPQPLGPDGPGERLWRACTAHTQQAEPEDSPSVTLLAHGVIVFFSFSPRGILIHVVFELPRINALQGFEPDVKCGDFL